MLKSRTWKLIWGLLLAGLLGFAAFKIWLRSDDLEKQLKVMVSSWVADESNGQYALEVGKIKIDADNSTIAIADLKLTPTSKVVDSVTVNGPIYQFVLKNLLIKNVSVATLLESNKIDLSTITINEGVLEITERGNKKPVEKEERKKRRGKNVLEGLAIDSIQLSKLNIHYTNRRKEKTSLHSVHLDLYNFDSDSLQMDQQRTLPVASFRLAMDSVHLELAKKKYRLDASQLIIKGSQQIQAIIKNVEIKPNAAGSLEQLAAREPVQADVYQCSIDEIVVDSFQYRDFLEDSILRTPLVLLRKPILRIFNDRSRPPATQSKLGKNPHQLIQKLDPGLDIPLVQIENGTVIYHEKNKNGTGVGKLRFEQISGNAGPILKKKSSSGSLTLQLSARLMGTVPLQAYFHFPPGNNGAFIVRATISPFNLTALNPVVEPLALASVRSGKSTKLSFTLRGDDYRARGTVAFLYEDLKLDLLKENEEGETSKRGFLSFLANQLVLRNKNTATDRHPNQYGVVNERIKTKSFFNLIWKTIFEGIKMSAGAGDKDKKPDR